MYVPDTGRASSGRTSCQLSDDAHASAGSSSESHSWHNNDTALGVPRVSACREYQRAASISVPRVSAPPSRNTAAAAQRPCCRSGLRHRPRAAGRRQPGRDGRRGQSRRRQNLVRFDPIASPAVAPVRDNLSIVPPHDAPPLSASLTRAATPGPLAGGPPCRPAGAPARRCSPPSKPHAAHRFRPARAGRPGPCPVPAMSQTRPGPEKY